MKEMKKITITIPNTKESTRYNGKNKDLAHYTIQWLNEELETIKDDYDISIFEIISDKTPEKVTPYTAYKIPNEIHDDHEKILNTLYKDIYRIADVQVHLQLTNFNRRKGLLKDAIEMFINGNNDVVSSYSLWYDDYSWREIKDNKFDKSKRNEDLKRYYDGSIYVFTNPKYIFDIDNSKWEFVKNTKSPIVDIDYKQQFQIYDNRITK